jgi:hypothetical protein
VTLDVDDEDLFLIRGEETIEKEAKPQGNGAHSRFIMMYRVAKC